MHLFDLAARHPHTPPAGAAPEWALGCFRRRCITFFDGQEDTTTEVLWLQSRGLTADFRRRGSSPRAASLEAVARLSDADRLALARVEGGLACSRWDGRQLSWVDWEAFQNHARWPEPGRLERVGSCLIEHAPSGAYVEDWRLERCGAGPLIGLRLIDERDADSGATLHRGGGLIVCGQRAALVRGRPERLPSGERLEALVMGASLARLGAVFACDAAFGAAHGDTFIVTHATLPWREGGVLTSLDGFEPDRARGDQLVQRLDEGGRRLERRFVIDTLEPSFEPSAVTPATPEASAWLARERAALFGLTPQR